MNAGAPTDSESSRRSNEKDVRDLDEDRLADLAYEAGIEWSEGDMIGPEPDRHDVEAEAQDTASEQLDVVQWLELNR